MYKIKKNDHVEVIKGKDRGKRGKVLEYLAESAQVVVEGVNKKKKHMRQTKQDQKGGIIEVEKPMSCANVLVVCKNCNRPVKVGFSVLKDGSKTRICKRCKEAI
ncbi:MAG: 50S ribosomal protein L24 [Candidatus Omnitrophota bacterium]|jgi:large subunit ribosomal protein L24|nr:50S ribosomal protein L24 [Candidatus Omnitrophota bacterium]MDD3983005.1 50S ribosomal protein L24 [Candidatus Omnitrophota bacterium]MDD5526042.1 50S ribosomal protein L24 [Candidatus Omnitrophota bacterium]